MSITQQLAHLFAAWGAPQGIAVLLSLMVLMMVPFLVGVGMVALFEGRRGGRGLDIRALQRREKTQLLVK